MADITFNVVVHQEPDGSFWSEVKELPGCFASGFDMDELQEATFEAIQMCLPKGVELGHPEWKFVDKSPRSRGGVKKQGTKQRVLVSA